MTTKAQRLMKATLADGRSRGDVLRGGALLLESVVKGAAEKVVPTETPPPYFPQNMLSPGDPKTARKVRVVFWGCAVLALVGAVALIVLVVYLIRSLV